MSDKMDTFADRKCLRGHVMPADARFCPECGAPSALAVDTHAEEPMVGHPAELAPGPDGPLEPGGPPAPRSRRRLMLGLLCAALVLTVTAGLWLFVFRATSEDQLTSALRDKGLAGRFASDAAAVAHAESVCRRLDNGGAQQGPEEDAVVVSIYCSKYASGFKTLRPIKVDGSFTLQDSSPSSYLPSISGEGSSCEGDGGYSDISSGVEVVVKSGSGAVLTTTQLGIGTGNPPLDCEFHLGVAPLQ